MFCRCCALTPSVRDLTPRPAAPPRSSSTPGTAPLPPRPAAAPPSAPFLHARRRALAYMPGATPPSAALQPSRIATSPTAGARALSVRALPPRPAAAPPSTASAVNRQVSPAAPMVEIPVTCYQILGITEKAEKDKIVKVPMELKNAEIEDGYTAEVSTCRQALLVDVRDKLLFKQEYAGSIKEKVPPRSSLHIPWSWLPAALCVLQELYGDGGASWGLQALKRAKEQAACEGRKLEEVVEERRGSLGHLAASVTASRAAPSHAHLHTIRGRRAGQVDYSEEHARGNPKEGRQGGDSGVREYLRDVSSRDHAMRKPKHDSVPWKRNRHNISSEDQGLISSAIIGMNKFSNDGSFMENINNFQSKNANVLTVEADEQRDTMQKSHKESSKKSPSVSTQKLNANQLAAKILQLLMKGKHE